MSNFQQEDFKKTISGYAAFGACCISAILFGLGCLVCLVLGFMQLPDFAFVSMILLWIGSALCGFVSYISGVIALWVYDNSEGII